MDEDEVDMGDIIADFERKHLSFPVLLKLKKDLIKWRDKEKYNSDGYNEYDELLVLINNKLRKEKINKLLNG